MSPAAAAVLGVNVSGFFHMTQRVIAEMEKQGSGHVVQITTTLVDHAISGVPSALASLTKGCLSAATNSLAIEYAKCGIREGDNGARTIDWTGDGRGAWTSPSPAIGGIARLGKSPAAGRLRVDDFPPGGTGFSRSRSTERRCWRSS